jgi:hypothetical protein
MRFERDVSLYRRAVNCLVNSSGVIESVYDITGFLELGSRGV